MKRSMPVSTHLIASFCAVMAIAFFVTGCDGLKPCACCSDKVCAEQYKCSDCPSGCVGCDDVDENIEVKAITVDTAEGTTMARHKADSGLEWEVLQEGTGETPEIGKTVVVHYTGWLDANGEPGKQFDSSVDRGQKFSFRIGVGMVIAGWDEGVMDMKVGEKRRLFISADLGYGSHGAGNVIPPDAKLIFDVELFEVA